MILCCFVCWQEILDTSSCFRVHCVHLVHWLLVHLRTSWWMNAGLFFWWCFRLIGKCANRVKSKFPLRVWQVDAFFRVSQNCDKKRRQDRKTSKVCITFSWWGLEYFWSSLNNHHHYLYKIGFIWERDKLTRSLELAKIVIKKDTRQENLKSFYSFFLTGSRVFFVLTNQKSWMLIHKIKNKFLLRKWQVDVFFRAGKNW